MAKIKIHVWHKLNGKITAIGRPVGESKCVPLPKENHAVFETEVEKAMIKELHRTHIVDTVQKRLVKHPRAKEIRKD
jgi:hypothetical protein